RATIVEKRSAPWIARFMLDRVFPYPRRFHAAARLLQLYQQSSLQSFIRSSGILRFFSPDMAKAEALMPELAMEPGCGMNRVYRAEGPREGTVALFTGCVMNSMLGSVNAATVRLLNAAGYDVVTPEDQICCGALANHAGLRETAVAAAKQNLAAFSDPSIDA